MNDGRWQVGDLLRDDEVELNPGERLVDPHPVGFVRIGDALNRRNEFVPGSESDVVVQILVARDVDLCCQLTVARRRYKKMDVRGTSSVATHIRHERFGVAARGQVVAAWHDRSKAVMSFAVSFDPPTEIIRGLRRSEKRVVAHRIGMLDIDDRTGDRVADRTEDLASHEQHLAVFGTVIEACFIFR